MENYLLRELRLARFKMRRQELFAQIHQLEQQVNSILGAEFPFPPPVEEMCTGRMKPVRKKASSKSKRPSVPAFEGDENAYLLEALIDGEDYSRLFTEVSSVRRFLKLPPQSLELQQLSCVFIDSEDEVHPRRQIVSPADR